VPMPAHAPAPTTNAERLVPTEPPANGAAPVASNGATMCRVHAEHASAATCVQCGRPSCLDCLVYVPGESDLWCVGCAETLRGRNLRLLRRRGA
jgi:hypothetical protein